MIQNDLAPLLREAIEKHLHDIIENEIQEVKLRLEKRVRAEIGSIAATVLERFSYERVGNELIIRVDFKHD
jgi:hypothetical protein